MTSRTAGEERRQPREPQTLIKETFLGGAAAAPVELFIMGPSVDGEPRGAARLRKELLQRAWDHDHYAATAELGELVEFARKSWGVAPDLCTIELEYARKATVLVFIPASNGSAAEVGFFSGVADMNATDRVFGEKSLVLLDRTFEDAPGFVALGPAVLLGGQGANVVHVDYSDHDAAWAEVEKTIVKARAAAARRDAFK